MPKLYCPPPLYMSAESVQSMHQDRCRCIQVHTLRLCPPLPVHACAFGLTLFCCIYYIIAYKKVKHQCVPMLDSNRDLIMNNKLHFKGRCFKATVCWASNFRGFSGPLSSSLILSHRRQQKSRAKFLFQRNFA